MGGARVTTLVTLRKCTLGHKREIKTLKFVSASTKGFKGGLSLDQALQERHGSDFFLLNTNKAKSGKEVNIRRLSHRPLIPWTQDLPLTHEHDALNPVK